MIISPSLSARELMARIRALLRCLRSYLDSFAIAIWWWSYLPKNRSPRGGEEIKLWAREYDVLVFLLKNVNHIFDADALIARVWPMESEVSPDDRCAWRLREKVDCKA
ncbi:MAG: winged helix-turn-helix domain-containing protein [Cyanobacteriota/Melainabacteria group bacterium]